MHRFFLAVLAVLGLSLAACDTQRDTVLDSRPQEVKNVQTIAIASISARTAPAIGLLEGRQGDLVHILTTFETELAHAMVNEGFRVIAPATSRNVYARGTDYEDAYVRYAPDLAAQLDTDDKRRWFADRMKEWSPDSAYKPDAYYTSPAGEVARLGLAPETRDEALNPSIDQKTRVTSSNTRMFYDMTAGGVPKLPRHTEHGGAFDGRFVSDAARRAIGQITGSMGADAYILIDADVLPSAPKEPLPLWGLSGGGTRYATIDGTAMLVSKDGRILAVHQFRHQSKLMIGGDDQVAASTERGTGLPLFGIDDTHARPSTENFLEASYQAVREAALHIAKSYADDRFAPDETKEGVGESSASPRGTSLPRTTRSES